MRIGQNPSPISGPGTSSPSSAPRRTGEVPAAATERTDFSSVRPQAPVNLSMATLEEAPPQEEVGYSTATKVALGATAVVAGVSSLAGVAVAAAPAQAATVPVDTAVVTQYEMSTSAYTSPTEARLELDAMKQFVQTYDALCQKFPTLPTLQETAPEVQQSIENLEKLIPVYEAEYGRNAEMANEIYGPLLRQEANKSFSQIVDFYTGTLEQAANQAEKAGGVDQEAMKDLREAIAQTRQDVNDNPQNLANDLDWLSRAGQKVLGFQVTSPTDPGQTTTDPTLPPELSEGGLGINPALLAVGGVLSVGSTLFGVLKVKKMLEKKIEQKVEERLNRPTPKPVTTEVTTAVTTAVKPAAEKAVAADAPVVLPELKPAPMPDAAMPDMIFNS